MKTALKKDLKELGRRLKRCRRSYERLNKGALARKVIKGRPYYYRVKRIKGRLTYTYVGKVDKRFLKKYRRDQGRKSALRKEMARLNKGIRFRERLLRVIEKGAKAKLKHPLVSSGIVRLNGF